MYNMHLIILSISWRFYSICFMFKRNKIFFRYFVLDSSNNEVIMKLQTVVPFKKIQCKHLTRYDSRTLSYPLTHVVHTFTPERGQYIVMEKKNVHIQGSSSSNELNDMRGNVAGDYFNYLSQSLLDIQD